MTNDVKTPEEIKESAWCRMVEKEKQRLHEEYCKCHVTCPHCGKPFDRRIKND